MRFISWADVTFVRFKVALSYYEVLYRNCFLPGHGRHFLDLFVIPHEWGAFDGKKEFLRWNLGVDYNCACLNLKKPIPLWNTHVQVVRLNKYVEVQRHVESGLGRSFSSVTIFLFFFYVYIYICCWDLYFCFSFQQQQQQLARTSQHHITISNLQALYQILSVGLVCLSKIMNQPIIFPPTFFSRPNLALNVLFWRA